MVSGENPERVFGNLGPMKHRRLDSRQQTCCSWRALQSPMALSRRKPPPNQAAGVPVNNSWPGVMD